MAFNKPQSQGETRNFEAGNKYPGKTGSKDFDKGADKKPMSDSESGKTEKIADKGGSCCS